MPPIDHRLLTAINELEQATTAQLADWLGLSYDHVRRNLKHLKPKPETPESDVLVLSAHTRDHQLRGSMPDVFVLGTGGRRKLRRMGIPTPRRHKLSELRVKPHTLAVNELLIKAKRLAATNDWLELADYRHEHYLLGHPLRVPVPGGKPIGIAPDLWLDFHLLPTGRYCLCFEVNLTRENEKTWRQKVKGYLYCVPVYEEMFGTDIITVAVCVGTRENFPKRLSPFTEQESMVRCRQEAERVKRMRKLKLWTERELAEQKAQYMADMFLFTCIPLDRATPEEVFLSPVWAMPGKSNPVPLIERTD